MDSIVVDKYRKIQNAYYSNSRKETDINIIKNNIARHFKDTVDFEENAQIDGSTQNLLVIKASDYNEKKIIAYPGETFSVGQIVDCYDQKWLITEVNTNNQIYTVGKMIRCSLLLKWMNNSGKIIQRWSVIPNANKTDGITEGKILDLPELNYLVILPLDSETVNLQRGKRFIADISGVQGNPDVFILTQRDVLSNNYGQSGTITLNLKQDSFNPNTDNSKLGIADYVAPKSTPLNNAIIKYTNEPVVKVGGSYKRFTAVFKNSAGAILTDIVPVWTLVSLIDQADKFVTRIDGNNFDIKALYYPNIIGSKIRLELRDSNNTYYAELIVEVGDL